MDNFLPANWTLSIWMESGRHLIKVTDNSTSKTAVLSISKCFHHLVRMPVSGPWGNRCVPRLQVKAHQVGIGLSVTPRDKARLSLVPTPVLHAWRHCTWNKLWWQLDSKGKHDTLAEPHSLLTPPEVSEQRRICIATHGPFLIWTESWDGSYSDYNWRPSPCAKALVPI